MGGRGYSSAAARNGVRRQSGVSGYGMKMNQETRDQNDALLSWGSQNFSNILNAQMGNGSGKDKSRAAALERFIGNSSYEHDIWRGLSMSEKDIKSLKVGGDLTTHNQRGALSSWSKGTGAPFEFATANADTFGGKPVMMVMVGGTKHGRSITSFVDKTDPGRSFEQEVLVSGQSKLKVRAVTPTRLAGLVDGYIVEVSEK